MSKSKKQNNKFSLSVSLDKLRSEDTSFVIDLRKKEPIHLSATTLPKKKKNKSSWKSKRVVSSLPFFFKPLTKHSYQGVFLDHRGEEIRDSFSAFEKKCFKNTFRGRAFSLFLALLIIFIPFKLLAYYKVFNPQSLKERITANSHLAINDLMSAASAASQLDLKLASSDFSGAAAHFLQAENDLKNIDESLLQLAALSGNEDLRLAASGKKFLQAGILASSMGEHFTKAIDSLLSKGEPKDSWKNFSQEVQLALDSSKELSEILEDIDPQSLPEKYRQQFLDLKEKALVLNDLLIEVIPKTEHFGKLFGISHNQRYLLIFQNNTEMRGGGGFMGSYALIDFSGGKIKNLEIPGGGTYDTKGSLTTFIKSPEALRLIAPRWFFWDANWFPDWALSAENIRWFYEKSGGPTVDGVIAFTPDTISGLLEITGPIDLTKEYGVVIDSQNFYELTQQIAEKDNLVKDGQLSVEDFKPAEVNRESAKTAIEIKQDLERNKGKKPKKIIGDLTAKILTELPKKVDRENIVKLLKLFEKSLAQKQLMFNFSDPELQAEVEKYNWAGRQDETSGDYLMVAHSNISGGKSDYKMAEKIEHQTTISADGKIINTVRITRRHQGVKGEKLFGMKNVDWLRIYVPEGSKLISSSGFKAPTSTLFKKADESWESLPIISEGEGQAQRTIDGTMIYNENGKTVFANWLITDPGTENIVEFTYLLPQKLTFANKQLAGWRDELMHFIFGETDQLTSYSLLMQKQPGAKPAEFSSILKIDNQKFFNIWTYPEQQTVDASGWQQSGLLDSDRSFGAILKNNY